MNTFLRDDKLFNLDIGRFILLLKDFAFENSEPSTVKMVMKQFRVGAVVVAQLEERSLMIPEVHNSNPVIGKIYIQHFLTCNCIEMTKAVNGPFKKIRVFPVAKKINFCDIFPESSTPTINS